MPVITSGGAVDIQSSLETGMILRWTVHPARRQVFRTLVVLVVAVLVAAIGWALFRRPVPALAGLLALLGSVSDFLLPSTYTLTPEGAGAASLFRQSRIEWTSVRRTCATNEGVRLSRYAKSSVLDAYRSVFLRFDGNREDVLTAISELRSNR